MVKRWVWAALIGLASLSNDPPQASAAGQPMVIFAFGDSLTAGYGLPASQSFPVKLEAALKARGRDVKVVNAGVSGDTTADGLARLDWSLPPDADAAIVEFGANDAFRGVAPAAMRANLASIVSRLKAKGLPVMISGMQAPRNMGTAYKEAFDRAFPDIARDTGSILYPFYLDGVALDPALNQPDGIHPNAKGVDVIVARILPTVEALVDRTLNKPK